MTTYFIGGAIGSATSAATYEAYGWIGICFLGAGFALLAILFWVFEQIAFNRK
jgi:cyanate permease